MKKIFIAFIIFALLSCALASCNSGDADTSVAESSVAQSVESSPSVDESSDAQNVESSTDDAESSIDDESVNDNESETASETVSESDTSEEKKEEIKVIISMEHASEELLNSTEEFPFYEDPNTDYSYVVFKTDTEVTNFRYFSVVSTDTWSDDGAPMIEEVLYTIDKFTPKMIFVAETVFADVYAVRGISFVDSNGNTQYFTLHDSAVDDAIGVSRADIAEKE